MRYKRATVAHGCTDHFDPYAGKQMPETTPTWVRGRRCVSESRCAQSIQVLCTNTFAYSYDAVGNRLTQNANGVVTNYGYDTANRLTSVNGQAYTWDANGNLLSDGLLTYAYDQANRLKTVTQGANTYTFAYNGLGDRLSQTVGVTQTRYALDLSAGLTQVLSERANA